MISTEFVAMQAIASRLWATDASWHPGEMSWQLATEQAPGRMRVWDDSAWGWMYDPDVLMLQVDPETPELAAEVVAWFDELNSGTTPRVEAALSATAVIAALEDAGYVAKEDEAFGVDLRCRVEPVDLKMPDGYVLADVFDVSIDQRVEAHRAAWLPAALPYVEEHRPSFAPDATSSFTAEKFERVQAMPLYAPERDFVVTTDTGDVAACCTVWLDESTGSAQIEPLGVVPGHRRRGLAQTLCRAALRAVAAAGGTEVAIRPRGDAAYPAPRAAYMAAGFVEVGRNRTYGRNDS